MELLHVSLAQINVRVGALAENCGRMLEWAQAAQTEGAHLVVFPELAVSGYPPEDLVLKHHFVEDCRRVVEELARNLPQELTAIVGTPWQDRDQVYNAAAILHAGAVQGVYRKMLLPNYGVFDEKRVFQPGSRPLVLELDAFRIGIHICEDSWYPLEAPTAALRHANLDLLVNLSGSPYHRGKLPQRQQILARVAAALDCPVLYCNLLGGQDELVFDGASMAVRADGTPICRGAQFVEERLHVDLPKKKTDRIASEAARDVAYVSIEPFESAAHRPSYVTASGLAPLLDDAAEVYGALCLGLRDYVRKNGFSRVLIAMSGGIDSALVAAIAADALGPEAVVTVTMPSPYSSEETQTDARRVAEALGIEFSALPISDLFALYLETLQPLWPDRPPDIAEENVQARIRGNLIMALSNKFGWLVLTTGNKSELAVGYCTLYGDMAGGFAVIKDVPKTLVFELARWRNGQGAEPVFPASLLDRPPSAELRPDQKDSDSLPPYETLDPILEAYVEKDMGLDEMVANGFDLATVTRVTHLVDINEYKRRQGPPGIKITPKAFGRDRRIPMSNAYREHLAGRPPPPAASPAIPMEDPP